jgi:hypothetical protein
VKASSISLCRIAFAFVTVFLLAVFLLLLTYDLRWSLGLCALLLFLSGLAPVFSRRTILGIGCVASLLALSVAGLYAWHVPYTDPARVGFPCATLAYLVVWWLLATPRLRSSDDATNPSNVA